MILAGRPAKILLIDTNVYFSKRLSDALKREGFEVNCSTQPSFALTTLEYDPPTAIVCSTSMREMGALDIARLVRSDAKTSALPVIALGDGSQRALMEAFQAGCDDYIDRTRPPAVIATHIRNIIISKAEGFQPTQMLPQADTSLSGSLTHHDLPGVMQMLGHAHQTGALHINSGDTDALLFFDAGTITHAECGSLFGDEAVIHILQSCMRNNSGVYKFAYGSASAKHTVLRSATDLMLDAMREIDEAAHSSERSEESSVDSSLSASPDESPFAPLLGLADSPTSYENAAIASAIDDFAANAQSAKPAEPLLAEVVESAPVAPVAEGEIESSAFPQPKLSESSYTFETPANELPAEPSAELLAESGEVCRANANSSSPAEPSFANYSIVPYAGNEIEDIT
jgi:CheY-like chemotaxis protein